MSLKYSLTFLLLAVAFVVVAVATWDHIGWGAMLFLYAALSFLLLAVAYGGVGARLLQKRPTGHQTALAWVVFAPYFLLSIVSFGLYRLLSREPAYVQAALRVSFGRRLSAREAASGGWVRVLDLAAEFAEVRPLRRLAGYRSLPVLDATAPSEEQLRSAVSWLVEAVASGPVYVHCALGHGRSACVVIAYLLAVGEVGTVGEGVRRLRTLRPGVRLHAEQRRRLVAFEKQPRQIPNE